MGTQDTAQPVSGNTKDVGAQFIAPLRVNDIGNVRGRNELRPYIWLCIVVMFLLMACTTSSSMPTSTKTKQSISTNNGTITYSASPQDVLIRTFYGGGKLGTLEFSPEISIYGDGSYILGPGLQMHEGQLNSAALQQLLHTLVDTDGLLKLSRQQFYDIPDQNATQLQLTLNGTHYTYLYGAFGNLQESAQDIDGYRRLGMALTSIRDALNGSTHAYASQNMILLVRQDFSPDLAQNIPYWAFQDFRLGDVAIYECGVTPQDINGPNADSGCLTYTSPRNVIGLSTRQLQAITALMHDKHQGVFLEGGIYYSVALRPLLPDELLQMRVAMLGSGELSYTGIPLHEGPVPTPAPTPRGG